MKTILGLIGTMGLIKTVGAIEAIAIIGCLIFSCVYGYIAVQEVYAGLKTNFLGD